MSILLGEYKRRLRLVGPCSCIQNVSTCQAALLFSRQLHSKSGSSSSLKFSPSSRFSSLISSSSSSPLENTIIAFTNSQPRNKLLQVLLFSLSLWKYRNLYSKHTFILLLTGEMERGGKYNLMRIKNGHESDGELCIYIFPSEVIYQHDHMFISTIQSFRWRLRRTLLLLLNLPTQSEFSSSEILHWFKRQYIAYSCTAFCLGLYAPFLAMCCVYSADACEQIEVCFCYNFPFKNSLYAYTDVYHDIRAKDGIFKPWDLALAIQLLSQACTAYYLAIRKIRDTTGSGERD